MEKTNLLEWENKIREFVTEFGEEEETEGAHRFWLGDLNGVCDIEGHTDVMSVIVLDDEVSVQVNTPDDMSTLFVGLGELPHKVVKAIILQLKA